MTTLAEITGIEEKVLGSKFQLEPHFRYDPTESENLLFLSPLVLLEDYELKQGGRKDHGAKTVLGRVVKDILEEKNGKILFQVPEVIYLHMGYGKNSENKEGKMALSEEDANTWKSFLDQTCFTSSVNSNEESSLIEKIDFPTPADIQALEHTAGKDKASLVYPSESGLEIPLKGRYVLLFSILLIFFDKKNKKKKGENDDEDEESDNEEGKIGANKISDFLLFWILPYLLNFNHGKVREIVQHHRVREVEFDSVMEMSTLDIIHKSFEMCQVSDEHKCMILDKYKAYYSPEQLEVKYKLLRTQDDTPIILVPKRYIVKKMPAALEDIKADWKALGNVTLLDEFMWKFVKNREIQRDFFKSLKDLKNRQGINYAIILPNEETFNEVIGEMDQKSAEYFSECDVKQKLKGGRNLITPRIGLVTSTEKHLTVCFSYFQGNDSRRVAALFRAIGAHYMDHFTLAVLHGLCCNHPDSNCRVGRIYPVKKARKISFKGRSLYRKGKGKNEIDFSEAQGRFCKAVFPETFRTFEQELQSDTMVRKMILQTQKSLQCNPKFESNKRDNDFTIFDKDKGLTVVYSTSANTKKLKSILSGEMIVQNPQKLEKYQECSAVNLNGCLLSRLAKYGRKNNIGVVLAINDICITRVDGSDLQCPPDALRRLVAHFVRAVVLAGLPEVYLPEPDEEDRDEIKSESEEDEDEEDDDEEDEEKSSDDELTDAPPLAARSGASGSATSHLQPKERKEGTLSEEDLEKLAPDVIKFWRKLGRRLRISDSKLDEIDIDYESDGVVEKSYQMLLEWRNRNFPGATYCWMYNVLSDPRIGRRDLARKHCC